MVQLGFEALISVSAGNNTTDTLQLDLQQDADNALRTHLKQSGLVGSSIGFLIGFPFGYPGAILGSVAGSLTGMGVGTIQWWVNQ